MNNWIARIFGLLGLAALMAGATAHAEECTIRDIPASFSTFEVTENSLVAQYFKPAEPGEHAAVLVLGGSEGGKDGVRAFARPLAEQGFAVLALSYFGVEGLPANLEEIPVEYFQQAVDWLARQPATSQDKIGIYGVSRGAEAALLAAAHDERLRAVVAAAPSHVLWQNINYTSFEPRAAWTLNNQPLAFVPYDLSNGFVSVFALYDGALQRQMRYPDAEIPVEDINGPILLVSGEKDLLWPSTAMADQIVKRLGQKGSGQSVEHLRYTEAGHSAGSPPGLWGGQAHLVGGGSEEGNNTAFAEAWPAVVCHFKNTFGG